MAVDPALRQRILETYPAFGWLVDVPEVGDLLARASTEGWDLARLQASLYATDWWKTRSEAARQAETLAQTDPATFKLRQHEKVRELQDFSNRMGLLFNEQEVWFIANGLINEGAGMDSESARVAVYGWALANPDRITKSGQIYANMQRAEQIAAQEFFYRPHYNDVAKYGVEAAFGYNNEEGFRQSLGEWMGTMMPHLAPRLNAGETLANIVNPFRDVIAKELELGGVEDVDMTTSNHWRWLTGMPDPTSGEVRLPTQQEVIEGARKDPRWKHTIGSTSLVTNLVDGVTKQMGVRA